MTAQRTSAHRGVVDRCFLRTATIASITCLGLGLGLWFLSDAGVARAQIPAVLTDKVHKGYGAGRVQD